MLTRIRHDHISTNTSRSNHSRFHLTAANLTGRIRVIQNLARALEFPLSVTSVMFYLLIYPTHGWRRVFQLLFLRLVLTGKILDVLAPLSIVLPVLVLPVPGSSREGWIGTKDNRANGGN